MRNVVENVLFRECAKNAYFRSASSDSDNKLLFLLALGTRLLLALLLVSSLKSIRKIYRKIYRFMNYIYKSLLQFCLWYEIPLFHLDVLVLLDYEWHCVQLPTHPPPSPTPAPNLFYYIVRGVLSVYLINFLNRSNARWF